MVSAKVDDLERFEECNPCWRGVHADDDGLTKL